MYTLLGSDPRLLNNDLWVQTQNLISEHLGSDPELINIDLWVWTQNVVSEPIGFTPRGYYLFNLGSNPDFKIVTVGFKPTLILGLNVFTCLCWKLVNTKVGSLKCASCSNWKVYIPKSYSFWVPLEVYIKRKSKIQCFGPVLSSWWFSIHLLELKIQLLWIPPCHTSKVASWLVDCWYEPHLWPYLSKNLLKVSKTVKIWQKCRTHEFSPVF